MTSYKRIYIAFTVLLLSPVICGSELDSQNKGVSTEQSEEIRQLEALANSGNADAQMVLANKYLHLGGEENKEKSLYWLKKAANAGQTNAQVELAVEYNRLQIPGVLPYDSWKESIKWYRLAAQKGHPVAQFNLNMEEKKALHYAIKVRESNPEYGDAIPDELCLYKRLTPCRLPVHSALNIVSDISSTKTKLSELAYSALKKQATTAQVIWEVNLCKPFIDAGLTCIDGLVYLVFKDDVVMFYAFQKQY